jgi:hypothetical protein
VGTADLTKNSVVPDLLDCLHHLMVLRCAMLSLGQVNTLIPRSRGRIAKRHVQHRSHSKN